MAWLPLVISLVSGAVGGNVAGAVLKKNSLGTLGNSIVGILGGGIGGQVLGMLGILTGGESLDIPTIVGNIASGGTGGGILLFIIGLLKKAFSK